VIYDGLSCWFEISGAIQGKPAAVMPGIHDRNGAPKCPKIEELHILLQNILQCFEYFAPNI